MLSWLFKKKKLSLPSDYRRLLDPDAVNIVEQLARAGFETYLVGGCVRDVLLRKAPKDFDIATQATPQQVKAIIKRSFIIGKRFRIVVAKRRWRAHEMPQVPLSHIFPVDFEASAEKEYQITTFRRDPILVNGVVNENVFGSALEDARRRDFTINALFLDPIKGKIVDLVGGMNDINQRVLRVIGDPTVRFKEDPIRIFRALRFIARAGLKMEKSTEAALVAAIPHLAEAKKERIREEIIKIFREGSAERVLEESRKLGIWKHVSPAFDNYLKHHKNAEEHIMERARAVRLTPWPHPKNSAPLLALFLYDIPESHRHQPGATSSLQAIEEDFKVSKAEKEEIHKIRGVLARILRDPTAQHATRLLGGDARSIGSLVSTFYVLKILADAGSSEFRECWKNWEPLWLVKAGSLKLHVPHAHSTGGTSASSRGAGSPARRRRRRGRNSARSTGASGTASPTTATPRRGGGGRSGD